jgi:gas vesicle protein
MFVLADASLAPAMIGLAGVAIGGSIGLVVPLFIEPKRARERAEREFRAATVIVSYRRRQIVAAVKAVGGNRAAEATLKAPRDAEFVPEQQTLRDEVYHLGGEVDALVKAFAHRNGTLTDADLESVVAPLRQVLILHNVDRLEDATLDANLKEWSARPL